MLHFADFLLPVAMHDLTLGILVVLLLGKHVRRSDIHVAHLGANDVGARFRLVLNGRSDVIRILEIHRRDRLGKFAVILCANLLHVGRRPESAVRLGHEIGNVFGRQFFTGRYFLCTFLTCCFPLCFLCLTTCFLFLRRFAFRLFFGFFRFLGRFLFGNQLLERLRFRSLRSILCSR